MAFLKEMTSILKKFVLETPNHYSHNNSSREMVSDTKKGGNLGLCTQTDLHLLDQRRPDALLLPTVRVFSDVTKEKYCFLGNI